MPVKKKDKLQEPSASGTPETNASGEKSGLAEKKGMTGENGLEEISLEEAFGMLDEITRSLEKEDISLEDSFSAVFSGHAFFFRQTGNHLAAHRILYFPRR